MSQENQETNNFSEDKDSEFVPHEEIHEFTETEDVPRNKVEVLNVEQKHYDLSVRDKEEGVKICHAFVNELIKMNMPERLRQNETIQNVLAIQQSMERFTLGTMFSIVSQAAKMLEGLDVGDCYDETGFIDPHKLNAFMSMQGHVMNAVMQFNMHIRRLPIVLQTMIRDAEMSQTYVLDIQGNAVPGDSQPMSEAGIIQSKKPMNALLGDLHAEAMRELSDNTGAGVDDYDGVDEDHAGITQLRKNTGEIDVNGNPIFITLDAPEDISEDDIIDEL